MLHRATGMKPEAQFHGVLRLLAISGAMLAAVELMRHSLAELQLTPALEKAVRYAADSVTRRGTQKAYATEAEFEAFCATIA